MKMPNRFASAQWLFETKLLSLEEFLKFRMVRWLPADFPERVLNRFQAALPVDAAENVESRDIVPVEAFAVPEPPVLANGGPVPREFAYKRIPSYQTAVHNVQNGKMFLGFERSTLILDERHYLRDISSPVSHWITPAFANAPADLALKGTVAVLFANGASLFGHWMFDLLPKVEVLRRAGWDDGKIDHYVVNSTKGSFIAESLSRLGIAQGKVVHGTGMVISGDRLLVPSPIRQRFCTPDWARKYVESIFLAEDSAGARTDLSEKVYISRAKAKRRRVVNETEIRRYLERRGFRTVVAEDTPVSEFAQLVRHSQRIVAPHGAGLTNVAFARPRIRVLELFGAHITAEYWLATNAVGGQHYLLAGYDNGGRRAYEHADRSPAARHARNEADFSVNMDELGSAIELMERG